MKRTLVMILGLCLMMQASVGAEEGWRGTDGKPAPEEESRRSVGGFGGWLLVTPDPDWEAKWNTPADTAPHFTTAEQVRLGEKLMILIFFGNPLPNAQGEIDIGCDLRVTRPDGTHSVNAKDVDCASGELQGPRSNLRLSNRLVGFVGEPNDPLGKWIVEVTLHDKHANLTVPLRTSFELVR